jgi:hypothetical protein
MSTKLVSRRIAHREAVLTRLVKHLVALIENENADAAKAQSLVADKSLKTTRSADNDVRASLLVLQGLDIRLDGGTAIEHTSLDVRHVLAEAVILVPNLVGQLTGVAHDNDRDLSVHRLNLLKGREDKDGRLSQTGLGLADDVTAEKSLRDTSLLDCRSNRC